MKKEILTSLFILTVLWVTAQQTENVILITLDGMRWQEVFAGADSLLVDDSGYVENPDELVGEFWIADPSERRALLLPFFWSVLVKEGQLYGNRKIGSKVDCSNTMWFSYPGYNEILCGYADDARIHSNDKIPNPNVTILEYLHKQEAFAGKVRAFGSWDVFPSIINVERSGVPVNAGFEKATGNLTPIESFLNKIQEEIRGPWGGVRLDVFTHHYAMECLRKEKPRLLYIAYGETDDYAHDGAYDQYLKSARQTDAYIREVWEYVQSDPQYRNKTTLIITTDHGRGTTPKSRWKDHGSGVGGAGAVWIAIIGPDTPPMGEVHDSGQMYQNQVAPTIAQALQVKYVPQNVGEPIAGALKK